ncbi:winged helix-turn-helix transcriptional regulator [Saccharothrix sp. ST-888]|uniref:winged helix-turn-helix transcriptional regulator n=1 Tax=Saccharothrix sp. ST-888 TaxID=1427391 RepID=UPI003FA6E8D2
MRELERNGLVRPTLQPETPPRVISGLLPPGHPLADRVVPVAEWGSDHRRPLLEPRA